MRNALAALSVLVSATAACVPQDLDWEIRFEPTTLSSMAVRLDARILKGPCPGTEVLWDETVHPGDRVGEPPELPEGTYCFGARAGDATCQWFAAGTTEAVLPREGAITVVVRAQTPESNCATTCGAGLCGGGGVDGGVAGADCPAGRCTRDCGTGDSCAHGCSGGSCTLRCGTGGDCTFSCEGGGCAIECGTAANCTASCGGGRCTMSCATGSECDFDCAGGSCGFICDGTADRCTTACTPGNCTGG